jgi:hypothetical protein
MRGAIHGIYKSAAEAIMPVLHKSAFKEKGVRLRGRVAKKKRIVVAPARM